LTHRQVGAATLNWWQRQTRGLNCAAGARRWWWDTSVRNRLAHRDRWGGRDQPQKEYYSSHSEFSLEDHELRAILPELDPTLRRLVSKIYVKAFMTIP